MKKNMYAIKITILFVMFVFVFTQNSISQEASEYTGSKTCSVCHIGQQELNDEHGHSDMLRRVDNGVAPDGVSIILPNGVDWENVSWFIGGVKHYARFVDSFGYVMTGKETQYSIDGSVLTTFKPEIPNGTLEYTCVKCHVTGWMPDKSCDNCVANDLEGIPGSWIENGIGCEACHGPGAAHVELGQKSLAYLAEKGGDLDIKLNITNELCGSCHKRTEDDNIIIVAGNLLQSRQQYSELMHSKKAQFKMTCIMCHEPHTTSTDQAGIRNACLDCHTGKFKIEIKIKAMEGLSCEDCHMPYAARGAYDSYNGEYHSGDMRSHLFGITTDPEYSINDGNNFAVIDQNGLARLTIDMTCYACHLTGKAANITREKLFQAASGIH